ncbi:MAG: HAMP domain-containing sensor histidine kinase [Deltaproteobacteria bacterium]|nr:HAMP domain-containing sensor histidine kinase [Deltaproteobacteria bacterium]
MSETPQSPPTLQALLNALDRHGVALELFDSDLRSLGARPALRALLGLDCTTTLRETHVSLDRALRRAQQGERVEIELDTSESTQDFSVFRVILSPVEGGGVLASWTDVTALRCAERSAKTSTARAERAERSKDQFLAMLSHELRSPIATILGWTQLLRGRAQEQSTIESAMTTVERAAKSQLRLIDDILVSARVVTGALQLDRRPTALRDVVTRAVKCVQTATRRTDIAVHLELSDCCMVEGDATRLEHAIFHLVSNAVKFARPGGGVRIALHHEDHGKSAVLEVEDDGMGIDPEVLPTVFDRFTQGESSLTRTHGGLGLGLSLARHLVEAHGGTIELRSEGPALGTQVTVRVPLVAA